MKNSLHEIQYDTGGKKWWASLGTQEAKMRAISTDNFPEQQLMFAEKLFVNWKFNQIIRQK